MKRKKIIIIVVVLAVAIAAYFLFFKKPSASVAASSSTSYSPDILAVLNRESPDIQAKLVAMLKNLSSSQMQMMDSIAHSWNNNIPLTAEQNAFWGTVGVF